MNKKENKVTYFKSQIIPGDPNTIVYWAEDSNGKQWDIREENIPVHPLEIKDVTYKPTERR